MLNHVHDSVYVYRDMMHKNDMIIFPKMISKLQKEPSHTVSLQLHVRLFWDL